MIRAYSKKLRSIASTSSLRRYSKHTTGPQGVYGRLPIPNHFYNYDIPLSSEEYQSSPQQSINTSISVTDPLVIYQNYVSRGVLKPDAAQLRAAVEFQKLYYRVKDYVPPEDVQIRIRQLVREIEARHANNNTNYTPSWYKPSVTKSRDLIKVLTDEEELTNFPSPHGFLLNGEVGCGKSMLMDIFANSLPHESKCRWHYSNFMLWVYNGIHLIYQRRAQNSNHTRHSMISLENEFILFEIAQKMIRKNTVLLLDEFMLPDLAAAKIVKLLFTYFFRLGGVLVATSNRLPEDLYATDFRKKEFRSFLRVLEARCYSLDMNSENDYRAILMEESNEKNCKSYLISKDSLTHEQDWLDLLSTEIDSFDLSKGDEQKITVYGRELTIPWHNNGVVKFDFNDICKGLYGPGDYISLASNYHTFIIDNVPVLKVSMKNEARRFITLLDALYESKCKLFLRTQVSPDSLFFPDTSSKEEQEEANRIKVQDEEMFSKTQIALTAPYRPNVSYYDDEKIVYNETETAKVVKNFDLSSTNFTDRKAFTGEDEKFAYKRAVSRMKEMTGSLHWRLEGKWTPVDKSMRPWERLKSEQLNDANIEFEAMDNEHNVVTGRVVHNASGVLAPVFNVVHFWSMGLWGKGNRLKDDIARKWIKGNQL
ncbi:unnamed protein product [Wickerhamomyces anomalus]